QRNTINSRRAGRRSAQGQRACEKSTAVVLSAAKDLRSCFLINELRTTAEMLRCAQHDRFKFFDTFSAAGPYKVQLLLRTVRNVQAGNRASRPLPCGTDSSTYQ